jgi:hypothetical protein
MLLGQSPRIRVGRGLGQNEGYQGSGGGGGKTKLDNTPPMDERSQGWFMIADRVNTLISSYSSRYFGEGRTTAELNGESTYYILCT